ncbi:very short patch repair endonuclease, partial [Salmonella enterica subsp. enterica serovar Infantis]
VLGLACLIRAEGITFHTHVATLPFSAEFVVYEYDCEIFTHGSFWHQHHFYMFKVTPTRKALWQEKIVKNVDRDELDIQPLQA